MKRRAYLFLLSVSLLSPAAAAQGESELSFALGA